MSELPPTDTHAIPPTVPHPAVEEDEMSTPSSQAPVADWDDEPMPGRARRRLLTPVTAVLGALLLGAVGFIVGVSVEKSQLPASSAGGGSGRRAPAAGTGGAGALAGAGRGGGAASAGVTIGTVASVSAPDLYVTDTQGNTIKVVTSAASTISRQVTATARGVHPGDAVVVQGPKAADGSVVATAVRDSGLSGGGGLGALFGGGGRRGGGAGAAGASGATAGDATSAGAAKSGAGGGPSLFGG